MPHCKVTQELLTTDLVILSHGQLTRMMPELEQTIDELIELQEQDIEERQSLDPVQSDRMTVANFTEGLSLIEKG
ncbi:hypothetical protein TNCV_4044121 [Trichonephila clavipes]|nr:hypothetical protein TNCV_4044121 [Trichonephila clavipes]